jgi:iron complex transport system substrate-binding protein
VLVRIVSLLPSATEIVFALGLGDDLLGVTHECDFPPKAAAKPRVTSTALPAEARTSRDIDDGINRLLAEGKSIYHLNRDLLERLQPNLILTQELCDVCAVAYAEVNRVAASVSSAPRVVSLEPNTLDQVLDSILEVGALAGCPERAEAYVAGLRRRLDAVAALSSSDRRRPRVYCMEWLDPPMRAGHWIPDMVALAGGEESFGAAGQPSTKCAWPDIEAYAPEVIVLMPCGYDLQRTLAEAATMRFPAPEVWAVDGSAYFSRPGPRLVDGVEILAYILGANVAVPDASVARLA